MENTVARSGQQRPTKPPRRRRWLRWILGGLVALVVLVVLAVLAAVKLQPSPPPLALPGRPAAAPAGQLGGTWRVSAGSKAGFRLRENFLGVSNEVTGRTGDVTGTAVLTGRQLSRATIRVSLDTITVGGKTGPPQLVKSLDTPAFPDATITLAGPVALPAAFSSGRTITRTAAATFMLHGTRRPVTVTLSARRDGPAIEAAGSLPVALADYGIKGPAGYGWFGSLASAGTAEFLLILQPGR